MKNFLSWKDVRKNAKDNGKDDADIDIDPENLADTEQKLEKPKKLSVNLAWELIQTFNDALPDNDSDDSSDDDGDIAAHNEHLRTQDVVTRGMTRSEYMYYSECRQCNLCVIDNHEKHRLHTRRAESLKIGLN